MAGGMGDEISFEEAGAPRLGLRRPSCRWEWLRVQHIPREVAERHRLTGPMGPQDVELDQRGATEVPFGQNLR